jgi:hypothetical protein
MFDDMYKENLQFFKDISLYIIAANKKIEELRDFSGNPIYNENQIKIHKHCISNHFN